MKLENRAEENADVTTIVIFHRNKRKAASMTYKLSTMKKKTGEENRPLENANYYSWN